MDLILFSSLHLHTTFSTSNAANETSTNGASGSVVFLPPIFVTRIPVPQSGKQQGHQQQKKVFPKTQIYAAHHKQCRVSQSDCPSGA